MPILSLIQINRVILQKNIFKCRQSTFTMLLLSPLEDSMNLLWNKHKDILWHVRRHIAITPTPLEICMVFYLNKLESPSPKDALRQIWLIFGDLVMDIKMKV